MVQLVINYWNGNFFEGTFEDEEDAKNFYEKNKENFREYAGEKYGFPYGSPSYVKLK